MPRKAPSGAQQQEPQATAEQEQLARLENDERLDALLQRLEQDETLSTAERRYS